MINSSQTDGMREDKTPIKFTQGAIRRLLSFCTTVELIWMLLFYLVFKQSYFQPVWQLALARPTARGPGEPGHVRNFPQIWVILYQKTTLKNTACVF